MVASFFIYCLLLLTLIDTRPSPTTVHWATWVVALCMEIVFLIASLEVYTSTHREPSAGDPEGGAKRDSITSWEGLDVAVDVIRVLFLGGLVFVYSLIVLIRRSRERKAGEREMGSAEETTGLLSENQGEYIHANGHANGHAYGGVEAPKDAWSRPDKVPSKSWWEYIRGYSLFFPYLWPAKSPRLQAIVVVCFVLISIARVVNVLVPLQVGHITNILAGEEEYAGGGIPWGPICLYIFYRFLQGNSGLISAARGVLWVPISQYSYRELSVAAFEHVHGLSLDFHLGKKTGEVLSALNKGNSINTFLEQVTFQVLPMLVDLIIAMTFLFIKFDVYYALAVAIVTVVYLYLTIRLAQWRADIRREMVNFSRQEDAVK